MIIIPNNVILYSRWASTPQTWILHRVYDNYHTKLSKNFAGRFFDLKKKAKWQDEMGNVFPVLFSILFLCSEWFYFFIVNDNHRGSSLGSVAFPWGWGRSRLTNPGLGTLCCRVDVRKRLAVKVSQGDPFSQPPLLNGHRAWLVLFWMDKPGMSWK